MKNFLPFFIAALMTLPVMGQTSSRESVQALQTRRQVSFEDPGKNITIPAAASRYEPFHFTMQRPQQVKNMHVLKQQLDSYVYQEFDTSTSSWINSSKNEFTYDGAGNNTGNIFYFWNPVTEMYEITGKDEFTYVNGNLTEKVHFDWVAAENTYVPVFQWLFAYNENSDFILGYTSTWNGSGWQVAAREGRSYDAEGNMVQQKWSWWDTSVNEWHDSSKTNNSYSDTGLLLISTTSIWDQATEGWVNSIKNETIYNGSGQLITLIFSFWNADISQWVNHTKEEYAFDENLNMKMFIASEWNSNQWINVYKSEMIYNNVFTSNEIILPWMFLTESGLRMMPGHMLTNTTDYDYTGESFVLTSRSQFNYAQVNLTAIAETETRQIRIYPQPATDQVTFGWEGNQPASELGIYDLNGKKVLSQQLDNNGSVNVDHLKPGLYFYRLMGNNKAVGAGKLSIR